MMSISGVDFLMGSAGRDEIRDWSQDAVLWILDIEESEAGDVIEVVRKRMSSRMVAASGAILSVRLISLNEVGKEHIGLESQAAGTVEMVCGAVSSCSSVSCTG